MHSANMFVKSTSGAKLFVTICTIILECVWKMFRLQMTFDIGDGLVSVLIADSTGIMMTSVSQFLQYELVQIFWILD